MENNNIEYKWKKLFASMRFGTDTGVISLTPKMQQELIDDISTLRELKENDSLHSVSVSDEDIYDISKLWAIDNLVNQSHRTAFIQGAEWMRDKLQPKRY